MTIPIEGNFDHGRRIDRPFLTKNWPPTGRSIFMSGLRNHVVCAKPEVQVKVQEANIGRDTARPIYAPWTYARLWCCRTWIERMSFTRTHMCQRVGFPILPP